MYDADNTGFMFDVTGSNRRNPFISRLPVIVTDDDPDDTGN
jgi:hypothetical protein